MTNLECFKVLYILTDIPSCFFLKNLLNSFSNFIFSDISLLFSLAFSSYSFRWIVFSILSPNLSYFEIELKKIKKNIFFTFEVDESLYNELPDRNLLRI
jgi:hypothetical protein